MSEDALQIGSLQLTSRVLLGTARYPNRQTLLDALEASTTQFVTVSLRRVSVAAAQDNLYASLVDKGYHLLPNSPMIDAGAPTSVAGQFDIDGQPRLIGRRPDMGADEARSMRAKPSGPQIAP